MDINKIFGAFDSSSLNEGGSYSTPSKPSFIDKNSPAYKIGMFQKMISNYTNNADSLVNFFRKADPSINVKEIKEVSSSILYERAYSYIEDIDLHNKDHIDALFREAKIDLETALNKSIDHFESTEEYEKCATLKKYLDFLNFSS
jgi:hypothetical protein